MGTLETKGDESRWAVLLPGYFPHSLNDTQRAAWPELRRWKKKAVETLTDYTLGRDTDFTFVGKVAVSIYRLWGKGQRAWDTDNLVGSVKPLVDALRPRAKAAKGFQGGIGIIEDDNPELLDLEVKQMKNESKRSSELIISLATCANTDFDPQHWDPTELATLIVITGIRPK